MIQVGPSPVTISELGRWKLSGNSRVATVKIVQQNNVDLPGALVTVNIKGSVKGSVLDIDMYIGQSHSPDMACKLRVEFAGAHYESW